MPMLTGEISNKIGSDDGRKKTKKPEKAMTKVKQLFQKFQHEMTLLASTLNTRDVKEVLEGDRADVQRLTYSFWSFLTYCLGKNFVGTETGFDGIDAVTSFLEEHDVVIFEGPKFDGLEYKFMSLLVKLHLFPPDSDETLWHNHGQSFFSSVIGCSGKYWHRLGQLSDSDPDDTVYAFEKQGDGDPPRFTRETPGRVHTMMAHMHQQGDMYFIDAQAQHTVQAIRDTGPVLTMVVQGDHKTNQTTIWKPDKDPIKDNFCSRDKKLPPDKKRKILQAIAAEIGEAPPPQCPQALSARHLAQGADYPNHPVFVVAKASPAHFPRTLPPHTPAKCALCGLILEGKALKEHENICHSPVNFNCLGCKSTFKNSEALRKHSRSKGHGISNQFSWEMLICDAALASPLQLLQEDAVSFCAPRTAV